ncbi:hypothetical protein [Methanomassiliicoccus luminyensis]|uniref:hypothetical protein n=1 Tax=Methanomassiliicoccus luminyensis TaxID=1080712 RepID=UPI00036A4CD9|nr:hypothetical protein [Methanomassiliicoccus luminyensis]
MDLGPRSIKEYYEEYLPLGDRLGECFYAVWMVVVTLGLLGGIAGSRLEVLTVILLAFSVNAVWGIIDGLSVMYGNLINRAKADQVVYDLQVLNDPGTRGSAMDALDDTIAAGLSREQKKRILDEIAAGVPERDPRTASYRPGKADRRYALGIVAIDVLFVIPLVAPLLLLGDLKGGIYWSRLMATAMMAVLGAAYARNLNRRRWPAVLFLAALGFTVFSISYATGW